MPLQPKVNFTVIGNSQDSQSSYPRLDDWNRLSERQKLLLVVVLTIIVFVFAIVIGGFCCYNACRRRRQSRYHQANHHLATAEDNADLIVRIRRPERAQRQYALSRHFHRRRNISDPAIEPQAVYVVWVIRSRTTLPPQSVTMARMRVKIVSMILLVSILAVVLVTCAFQWVHWDLCAVIVNPTVLSVLKEHGLHMTEKDKLCLTPSQALLGVFAGWIAAITMIIPGFVYLTWCIKRMTEENLPFREVIWGVDQVLSPREQRLLQYARMM